MPRRADSAEGGGRGNGRVQGDPRRRFGYHGKQGLDYFAGVSAESASSKAICMHLLVMPPGAEAKPHYHEAHETAIYMLEGEASFRHGAKLEHLDHVKAGDFIYIPAGVPHQPFNPTDAHGAGRSSPAPTRTSRRASCCSTRRSPA